MFIGRSAITILKVINTIKSCTKAVLKQKPHFLRTQVPHKPHSNPQLKKWPCVVRGFLACCRRFLVQRWCLVWVSSCLAIMSCLVVSCPMTMSCTMFSCSLKMNTYRRWCTLSSGVMSDDRVPLTDGFLFADDGVLYIGFLSGVLSDGAVSDGVSAFGFCCWF